MVSSSTHSKQRVYKHPLALYCQTKEDMSNWGNISKGPERNWASSGGLYLEWETLLGLKIFLVMKKTPELLSLPFFCREHDLKKDLQTSLERGESSCVHWIFVYFLQLFQRVSQKFQRSVNLTRSVFSKCNMSSFNFFYFLVHLLHLLRTISMPIPCFKQGCKYTLDHHQQKASPPKRK